MALLLPARAAVSGTEIEKRPALGSPPGMRSGGRVLLDGHTSAERARTLVRYVASCRPNREQETYPKASAPIYAARLLLNVETKDALAKLDAAVTRQIAKARDGSSEPANPLNPSALDPFDKVALINTYFLCKSKIPPATARKIRDYTALYEHKVWRGYGAMNYRLMMDGSGFLAAEEWPELVDTDGLDAAGIRKATQERLFRYFDGICRRNFDEYGAPIYLAVNLSAMRMLAEFAREPEMRKRATLTLDAMLLDVACTWNQGYNIGSASRAKYWYSTDTSPDSMASTAAAAWVFFGAFRPISASGTGWQHSFWMAAPGHYKVPDLIVQIAQDRSRPFVHEASVPALGSAEIRRTTFHSFTCSLASQWDHPPDFTSGIYKESRRNLLKWVSDKPSSTFAVCMENPYRPYKLQEGRANDLGYGENPFSQYLQHEGTLIGLYSVPEHYPYYKLYAPFTTRGAILKRIERSGWVFCHNGAMLMAFHCVKPHTWSKQRWSNNDLLWCDARKNGWVLETAELKHFAGGGVDAELNRFAQAMLASTTVDATGIDQSQPRLAYTSLSGHQLDLTWLPHSAAYTNQARINGQPVDYLGWPLLRNTWVYQQTNSPNLKIEYGGQVLQYDFGNWTRSDDNHPASHPHEPQQ